MENENKQLPELTKEVCEGKIRYWSKKLYELEQQEQAKEEKASKLYNEIATAITAGTTMGELKKIVARQIEEVMS